MTTEISVMYGSEKVNENVELYTTYDSSRF